MAALAATPIDVVKVKEIDIFEVMIFKLVFFFKTRLMNQKNFKDKLPGIRIYKGSIDCLVHVNSISNILFRNFLILFFIRR
jgi:hypothetical protein